MHRSLSLLFLFCSSVVAQSQSTPAATYADITVMKYCEGVQSASATLPTRMFAQVYSGFGSSSGWAEFSNKAAWRGAGSPSPVALVWYKGSDVVRVAIAAKNRDRQSYANYCYRPDGTLAEFRSVPVVETQCDSAFFHCDVTLRGGILVYPPPEMRSAKPALAMTPTQLKAFGLADFLLPHTLQPESSSVFLSPMHWPEYLNVSELPFSGLLSVSLNATR